MRSDVRPLALLAAVVSTGLLLAPAATAAADTTDADTARNIACDQYAVGAATIDYRDLTPWTARMTQHTTGELRTRLDATIPQMRKLLTETKYVSTAKVVNSWATPAGNDVWRVTCDLSVHAVTVKTPNGADSAARYTITVDKSKNWAITDSASSEAAEPLPVK